MKTKDHSAELLLASIFLNIVLVACIFWFGVCARRALLQAAADAANQSARLQTEILADLESDDSGRIEALKDKLRVSIDVEQRVEYKIRTEAYEPTE